MTLPLSIRPFNGKKVPKARIDLEIFIQFLQKEGPLDIEIGCGVGWHPIQYSISNPKRKLIAIEHTAQKFAAFQRRLGNHPDLPNLLAVHANAIAIFTHNLPAASVDRIFLFYPNPEPKNVTARWIRSPFFSQLLTRLKPEGRILLVTNEKEYFEEVEIYARSFWKLHTQATVFDQNNPIKTPRTHFEKKYLERNQTIYQIQLFPVEPKPPSPRSVFDSSDTSSNSA